MKKSKYGMPPPSTRAEFEHNIGLSYEDALRKLNGKQLDPFFVQRTLPQLKSIEFLPNGRVNLNTVDESLRLQANMHHWMELMPPPEIMKDDEENN